jgi:hypothetical protein
VSEQVNTENKLTGEAKRLELSLGESTGDIAGLLAKVQRATCDADVKAQATSKLGESTLSATAQLKSRCADLSLAIVRSSNQLKVFKCVHLYTLHTQCFSLYRPPQ